MASLFLFNMVKYHMFCEFYIHLQHINVTKKKHSKFKYIIK